MINRKDILEYSDMVGYLEELKTKRKKYINSIEQLEKRISEIENGEIVKDSVKGGAGGIQTFRIEGYPSKEYQEKRTRLLNTKLKLESIQETIEKEELKLIKKVDEVEKFLSNITDQKIKRIINLRINGESWNRIADTIGGDATENSVRMLFNRYFEKNQKNS